MEIKFLNYDYNNQIIDLEIKSNQIIGIASCDETSITDLISLRKTGKGQLTINDAKITKDNLYKYQKQISLITKKISSEHCIKTVEELMIYIIKQNNLNIRDEDKKIKDSLKIVGLDDTYLNRKIRYLSSSERKLIQVSISLLSNPELIIMDEPFIDLDNKNEKKIIMLLQRLKEQFKKTIIIISSDSNILYKYTESLILLKKGKILIEGKTEEIYLRVDYLKRNRFEIPEIVEFTYLAKKKKNAKIDFHKDIRDIIKDIYKHI